LTQAYGIIFSNILSSILGENSEEEDLFGFAPVHCCALPQMSIAPYIEYGAGVQRRWGERFTGFGQAMLRGGGRNGVAFQFGFRIAIGK
jgi:hypothetical protein